MDNKQKEIIISEEEIEKNIKPWDTGVVKEIKKIKGGIVNDSYKITAAKGIFVAQRLNKIFNEKVIEDWSNVQQFLEKNNFQAPKILKTKNGKKFHFDGQHLWRLLNYIENEETKKSEKTIFEAGKTLAKFHKILENFNYQPKFKIPNFHQTKKIIQKLAIVFDKNKNTKKANKVKKEVLFVLEEVKKYYLPESLPTILIHGDPKFENFLFKNNKVVGLVDLDTITKANSLIDIGDAFRSWCSINNKFNLDIYKAALNGYQKENPDKIIDKFALKAIGLIILELCARFLTDYFEESYFSWDPLKYSSLSSCNLERYNEQINYYRSFLSKNPSTD